MEGTTLGDYHIEIVCRGDGGDGAIVAGASGPSVDVQVRRNDAVVCTITNTAEQEAETVRPVLECVVFNATTPDLAVWGYANPSGQPVPIPVGADNRFTPNPADRGQPEVFEPGRVVGVLQTPFQAGAATLEWTLSGETATASRARHAARHARAAQGRRSTVRSWRLRPAHQRPAGHERRQRDDTGRCGRRRRGSGERDGRIRNELADYGSSVSARATAQWLSRSRDESRRSGRAGRRRRLHVHEPEDLAAAASAAAASAASAARPRGCQDGSSRPSWSANGSRGR